MAVGRWSALDRAVEDSMSAYDSAALESAVTTARTDIDERTEKALTQYLTVLPEGPDLYSVTSESGNEYRVDTRAGRCTCDDHQYRDVVCKHRRRVAFATGEEAIPANAAAALDVDEQLGDHVDGELRVAAADGGIIVAGDDGELIDEDNEEEDVVDLSEEYGEKALCGTCVGGQEWCPGVSGMYFGQFPCASCWLFSPGSAHYYFGEWEGDE
jgi:hypothetical protein